MQPRVKEIREKKGKQVLNLTKFDLVAEYANYQNVSAANALDAVDSVLICIRSLLASMIAEHPELDMIQFTLANFGRFDLKKVPEHIKHVNHLDADVVIPEGYKLGFAPSGAWNEMLKK